MFAVGPYPDTNFAIRRRVSIASYSAFRQITSRYLTTTGNASRHLTTQFSRVKPKGPSKPDTDPAFRHAFDQAFKIARYLNQ
jgi:hypothetical protein